MLRYLALLLLALAAPALAQGADAAPDLWTRSGGRMVNAASGIAFPARAGEAELRRAVEFSHQGEGVDTGLQYATDDEEVFATVYVYYPGLAHAGLTAVATDDAIRDQSGSDLRVVRSGPVAAGGRDSVAIRTDYAGFRDQRMASSAAFIKAGRWIVKLRVSGPESRRGDVERAMTDLLDGIRFGSEATPRPAAVIELSACPPAQAQPARLLESDATDALEEAVIGVLDGGEGEGREEGARQPAATPLVGRRWCRSTLAQIGTMSVPILRSVESGDGEGHRSIAIAIVGDSGSFAELVSTPRDRVVLLFHDIGRTRLLGAFATPPTDEQIALIIAGVDRAGGRVRATVQHRTDGNSAIEIHEALPEPAAPTT